MSSVPKPHTENKATSLRSHVLTPKSALNTRVRTASAALTHSSVTRPAPTPSVAPLTPVHAQQGAGSDFVKIKSVGKAFPSQAYLNNIVNQIGKEWTALPQPNRLVVEVKFTIHRDGSVSDIGVISSSKSLSFDAEATGAIEAAGNFQRLGKLPAEWTDDVLIVYFTFDHRAVPSPV